MYFGPQNCKNKRKKNPERNKKHSFISVQTLICSFGDGVQYPVLAKHLPENIAPGPVYYESKGHSIIPNRNGNHNDDDDGIENIMLENGITKRDSLTNVSAVSTKASTGALLSNEGDDNLSVSSSSQRNSRTLNNVSHNSNNSALNGTVMTNISIPDV